MLPTTLKSLLRMLLGLLLLAGVVMVATRGAEWWPGLRDGMSHQGAAGMLLFVAVFVGLTTLCFPVSVLGFTAGVLYGPWLGLAVIFPAGLVSGSFMFVLGKNVLRSLTRRLVGRDRRLAAMEHLATRQAVRLNLLARLTPINFGLVSYGLASGQSPYRAYLIGLLAILPSLALQVWVGALVGQGGQMVAGEGRTGTLRLAGLVFGIVFLLVLSWQIGRLVRQALAESRLPLDEEAAPEDDFPAGPH